MSDATHNTAWLAGPWDTVRAILTSSLMPERLFLNDAERADVDAFVGAMDRMREATGMVTDLSELTPTLGSALHFSIELKSIEQKQQALMVEIDDLRARLRTANLKAAS